MRHKARLVVRVRKLPCFRAHRRRFDSSIPRNDGVACFWLRKKKNKGGKEERKRLEVASISIEPWMEKRGLTDGWNFFVQFILYFAYREKESTIEFYGAVKLS